MAMSVSKAGRWQGLAIVAAVGLALVPLTAAKQDKNEKQVVVAIVSNSLGKASGVTAADVIVKEDGQERKVLKVEPFTEPMSVVLLADTTSVFTRYGKELQATSRTFFGTFMPTHQGSSAALWEFGGSAAPVKTFTTDAADLDKSAGQLKAKEIVENQTSESRSALLVGVFDAANALAKQPEVRRVIVSFNAMTPLEQSKLTQKQVQEALEKANVSWFAVTLRDGGVSSPLRETVMAEQIPQSGGIRVSVTDPAALEGTVKAIAGVFNSQYTVTYARPSGSAKQVEVAVKAEGVRVLAPKWAPK